MIIFDKDTKTLEIPAGLGNLEVNIITGSTTAGVSSLDGQTGALTLKTINGNHLLGEGDIHISGGTGTEVSYTQTLTAGTEIGEITIDGSATTIYAPTGGGGKPTYNLDTMSDAERADLFNLLSGQTAADVNLHYDFYTNSGRGDIETRLKVEVYGIGDGGVRFAGVFRNMIDRSRLWVFNSLIEPNGNLLNEPYNYSVAWNQIVTGGTKIATFTMNETTTDVYAGNVSSTAVNNIWVGTTAQYNAIATKDPKTLYFINDN